ncbi:MAG: prohibitin family protein [bacterium]|nr:prohibitin family protein [bacterium]
MMEGLGTKVIAVVALLLIGGYFFLSTVIVVDAGHTGVKKTLGKVDKDAYPPGVYIVVPVMSSITQLDNRVMRLDGDTSVYTKDVQQAQIKYALNYSLDASATVKMYTEVGIFWSDKLIPQVITSSMKNVIGQWAAMDLIANRLKAQNGIEEMIASDLKAQGISISAFALTNIDFQDQFENAVEAKVVAVQSAEMAKNQTVQIEEQAKQRLIAARADAESMMIKNEALAKNQSLIMYEAVQKWDGQLPKITGGGSGGNFLNIPESMLSGNK